MWEVGLWGPKNVGSGTFKMLCHPPPISVYMMTPISIGHVSLHVFLSIIGSQ